LTLIHGLDSIIAYRPLLAALVNGAVFAMPDLFINAARGGAVLVASGAATSLLASYAILTGSCSF
jgi:hypothetical protein